MYDHSVKWRWVFSPLVETKRADGLSASVEPIAAEYSLPGWIAPMHHEGFALVLCAFTAHQLASARQDPRLIVCASVHSPAKIDDKIADHHAQHGAVRGMILHELLTALAKHHHCFEPEF